MIKVKMHLLDIKFLTIKKSRDGEKLILEWKQGEKIIKTVIDNDILSLKNELEEYCPY
jgi:hypothetical protein